MLGSILEETGTKERFFVDKKKHLNSRARNTSLRNSAIRMKSKNKHSMSIMSMVESDDKESDVNSEMRNM